MPPETPEVPETTTEPAVDETVQPGPTEEEIQAAEKQLDELERKAAQAGQGLTAEGLAEALGKALPNAIQPLIPKPPELPNPWDSDDFFNDRKAHIAGLEHFTKRQLETFYKEKIQSLEQKLSAIGDLLPQLVARSAENPQYNQLDREAREIMKEIPGTTYWQAFNFAQRAAKNASQSGENGKGKSKSVPPHLSSPDTKQTSIPDVPDKGPANFKDIVRGLRAKGDV